MPLGENGGLQRSGQAVLSKGKTQSAVEHSVMIPLNPCGDGAATKRVKGLEPETENQFLGLEPGAEEKFQNAVQGTADVGSGEIGLGSSLLGLNGYVDSNDLTAAAFSIEVLTAAARPEVSQQSAFPSRKLIDNWLEKREERQKMAATRRKMALVRSGRLCQLVPADHGYIDSRLEKERTVKASAQALPPNIGRATLCYSTHTGMFPGNLRHKGLSGLAKERASRLQFQRTRGVYRPIIVQFYGREAVEALSRGEADY